VEPGEVCFTGHAVPVTPKSLAQLESGGVSGRLFCLVAFDLSVPSKENCQGSDGTYRVTVRKKSRTAAS